MEVLAAQRVVLLLGAAVAGPDGILSEQLPASPPAADTWGEDLALLTHPDFELLAVDESIRELISQGSPLSEIRQMARKQGMRTLAEDGQRLIDAGLTSEIEVQRVVQGAF